MIRRFFCAGAWGFIILLGPALVQAQTASIRGIVTGADQGTALMNANVVLLTLEDDQVAAAATDVDGFYELRNLESGAYQIRISHIGYETHRDTVKLGSELHRYSVSLPETDRELEEVRVEAERGASRREAGLQTVGVADLERIPTAGPSGDLAAYMHTLPGVVSVGDRGGDLYVRGGTPSQNLILVDGLRILQPFHISNLYSAFPEEIVKSADVHAGGFGAEYMGAISSVIDVTLRQGNMKAYEGSASISPFLVSGQVEGPIYEERASFLVSARQSVVHETAPALFGRSVPLRFYDATARYSLQADNASCNLTGVTTHDYGQINPSRDLALTWTNRALGGRCLFFGENLDRASDLRVGYTHFQNEAGTPSAPQRSASVRKLYMSLESEQDLWGHTIAYGGRWVVNSYAYDLDESFTTLQGRDETGGALQLHASMNWSLGRRLTVTPSFGTHMTVRRLSTPTYEPRLRLKFRPNGTDNQEISVAVGKYNQVAEALSDERDAGMVFTVWRPSGDGDPLVEALHAILGYRQQLASSVTVNVEGFAKQLSNIPAPKWSPVAQFDTRTALANGLAYGADVRTEYDSGPLYLFFGYGWSKVTYSAAQEDLGAWVEGDVIQYSPSHDRRHQINIVASYEIGEFTANVNWQVGSGRPYTKIRGYDLELDVRDVSAEGSQYPTTSPGTAKLFYERPYNARLPWYHRFDISVERTFRIGPYVSLDTQIGAINTYDRRNVFYYDVSTLERVDQTPVLPYLSVSAQLH